jgi:hypothetical protein
VYFYFCLYQCRTTAPGESPIAVNNNNNNNNNKIGFRWVDKRKIAHLESPMRKWEENIKMDLQEIGWGGVD